MKALLLSLFIIALALPAMAKTYTTTLKFNPEKMYNFGEVSEVDMEQLYVTTNYYNQEGVTVVKRSPEEVGAQTSEGTWLVKTPKPIDQYIDPTKLTPKKLESNFG